MPLSMCTRCNIMISISNLPGGNPVARMNPQMMTCEYGQCNRCRLVFCGSCIRSSGNKCPECGQAVAIQGPPAGPPVQLPEAQRQAIEKLLRGSKPASAPPPKPPPAAPVSPSKEPASLSPEELKKLADQMKSGLAGLKDDNPLKQLLAKAEDTFKAIDLENEVKQSCVLLQQAAAPVAGTRQANDREAEMTAVAQAIVRAVPSIPASTAQIWARKAITIIYISETFKVLGPAKALCPAFSEAYTALAEITAAFKLMVDGPPEQRGKATESARQGAQALSAVAQKLAKLPPQEMVSIRCPNPKCNKKLKANRSLLGKKVKCTRCATTFVLSPAGEKV